MKFNYFYLLFCAFLFVSFLPQKSLESHLWGKWQLERRDQRQVSGKWLLKDSTITFQITQTDKTIDQGSYRMKVLKATKDQLVLFIDDQPRAIYATYKACACPMLR